MELDCKKIAEMRFPLKMWILTYCPNKIMTWGRNGTTILIDYSALEDYLVSESSIFKTKNRSSFIRQMNIYNFHKLTIAETRFNNTMFNPFIHEYQHIYFQKDKFELLSQIVRKKSKTRSKSSDKRSPKTSLIKIRADHLTRPQKNDLCSRIFPSMARIAKARRNLQHTLEMQSIINNSDNLIIDTIKLEDVPVINLKAEIFQQLVHAAVVPIDIENGCYSQSSEAAINKFFENDIAPHVNSVAVAAARTVESDHFMTELIESDDGAIIESLDHSAPIVEEANLFYASFATSVASEDSVDNEKCQNVESQNTLDESIQEDFDEMTDEIYFQPIVENITKSETLQYLKDINDIIKKETMLAHTLENDPITSIRIVEPDDFIVDEMVMKQEKNFSEYLKHRRNEDKSTVFETGSFNFDSEKVEFNNTASAGPIENIEVFDEPNLNSLSCYMTESFDILFK